MNRLTALLVVTFLISAYSCKKKDQIPVNPPTPPVSDIIAAENNRFSTAVTSQTITAFISGTIIDEDGKSLVGVSVSAGSATVTTNDNGYFQFPASVTVNKDYATITAALNGFFKATRTFTPNSSGKANHYFEIKLLKRGSEKSVGASGGNVVLDNKVDITFPDAAVVTSTGSAYTGQYKVVGRYIDPAAPNFLETMPGMLAGLNDQNQMQALQSFGMAIVELKDAAGNSLQLASGKKAILKLPAPANSPATIPIWHFNEKYGLWIQAGVATKTGDSYTAEVNHFSTWNLDLPKPIFTLDLQFKDPLGNALSGLQGEVYVGETIKLNSFFTDNEGKLKLGNCPEGMVVTIKTFFQCDTAAKALDPVTANRSEVITVSFGADVKSYTIAGKISGCDNGALVNQPFKLTIQGPNQTFSVPGATDAQGNYTITSAFCNNGNAVVTSQASAFINNEYRYAPAVNISLANSTYNAKICDTAAGVADDFEVLFPDHGLDSTIRAIINKPVGTILYKDVKNIDSISTFDKFNLVSDLSGIQFCTNLRILRLYRTQFSDLGPLKTLSNLQNLALFENIIYEPGGLISDISPLENLTQLQSLDLRSTNVSDLSSLQNLEHLKYIFVSSNSLSDISPIRNLTQLQVLGLKGGSVNDLSALQNLAQLSSLWISSNALDKTDLEILRNFSELVDLEISATSISDFSLLKDLPQLKYLHLEGNQISDISQFTSMSNLTTLDLAQNQIIDISSLQTMTQLQDLELSYNQISDVSSLGNLRSALAIQLDYNLISNLTPLQTLDSLQLLYLRNNNISNISPLINGAFPKLLQLFISNQQPGKITQAQQDAFSSAHPACTVIW